jgi:hypothetical protein
MNTMKLSKEAKEGFEWAVWSVIQSLNKGAKPEQALKEVGIDNWEETLYFMEFLRESGRTKLLNRLSK